MRPIALMRAFATPFCCGESGLENMYSTPMLSQVTQKELVEELNPHVPV